LRLTDCRISSTRTEMRQLQFGLKLVF